MDSLAVATGDTRSQPPLVALWRLTATDLARARRVVVEAGRSAGLDPAATERLILAVNEIVTNAIRHGGGTADLRVRLSGGRVEVEIEDDGPGIPPGVIPIRPAPEATHGRGLWLARQLCDGIDVRSGRDGTLVRLSMRVADGSAG